MSPVSARRKGGITYRYYVSRALQTGGVAHENGLRVPADVVEGIVIDRLSRLGLLDEAGSVTDWTTARRHVHRLDLGHDCMTLLLDTDTSEKLGGVDRVGHRLQSDEVRTDGQRLSITISAALARRGGQVQALGPSGHTAISQARVDPALSAALVRAEAWKRKLLSGQAATIDELAKAEGFAPTHASRLLRAAFLAPDIKRMIIEGRQPAALTLQTIMTKAVPLDWRDQRRIYLGGATSR